MSIAVSHNSELSQNLHLEQCCNPCPGLDFTKFTLKYLLDHDSHCKDCISFIDVRNMMILTVKKTLALKQSTVYVTNRDREYQRLAAECERLTRTLISTQC